MGEHIEDFERFHPRAVKLLRKQKNFLVVAEDEPYFLAVYAVIRVNEKKNGRWTKEDERIFQEAVKRVGGKPGEIRRKILIGTGSRIQIPKQLAVCPYCGARVTAFFEGWSQNEDGAWSADIMHLDCEGEPAELESDAWEGWLQQHSDMPYVYMLPVEERVRAWVNRHFVFEIEAEGHS